MKIQIRNNEYAGNPADRKVKQIELFIGGIWFVADVVSERDLRLAENLANNLDLKLFRADIDTKD